MPRTPYSHFKAAHHSEQLQQLQRNEIPYPITLQIDLTNTCGASCSTCYNRYLREEGSFKVHDQVDYEQAVTCVTDSKCLGVHISGGGEPLEYREFDKFCLALTLQGVKYGFDTNGILLRQHGDAAMGAKWARISLNAASEGTHSKVHHVVNKFNDIVEAVSNLTTQGATISLNFLVCQDNIGDIYNASSLGRDLGCRGIRYTFAITQKGFGYFTPFKEEMVRSLQLAEQVANPNFTVEVAWDRYYNMDDSQTKKSFNRCYYSHLVAVVGANGHLYPCCDLKYLEPDFGDILRQGFHQVWFGEEHVKWLRSHRPQGCVERCDVDEKNEVLCSLIEEPVDREFI